MSVAGVIGRVLDSALGSLARRARARVVRADGTEVRIIDGDTLDVGAMRVRLEGIDTPETGPRASADERALGRMAADRLREIVEGAEDLRLHVSRTRRGDYRRGKYGRVLGRLSADGADVARALIDEGYGRTYDGGRR